MEVVAIDGTGLPVRLTVSDPRVYALHKAWVSKRPDRNNLKREKDMKQAMAVSTLNALHLPSFPFDDSFLAGIDPELQLLFVENIEPVIKHLKPENAPRM